jgi:hypothetical protein
MSSHATGRVSHAEGTNTEATGDYSHAQNNYTVAASADQTAMGRYNARDANGTYALIVGNGTGEDNRSNAHTLDWQGNAVYAGDVTDGSGNVLSDKADTADLGELAAKDSVSVTVTSVSGSAKNTSAINTSYGYTIPISTPSGYTPIGIRSIAISGTNNNNLVLRRWDIVSSSSVTVAFRNTSSTDVAANAVTCTVEVYCIKTSAS